MEEIFQQDSVGMVMGIKNPIKLARQIMERMYYAMIVSDGVAKLSRLFGSTVEEYPREPNEKMLNEYNNRIKNVRIKWKRIAI